MAIDLEKEKEKIRNKIEEYEKKPLSRYKIYELRDVIESARQSEDPRKGRWKDTGTPKKDNVEYKGKKAKVASWEFYYGGSDLNSTTHKCVIADDYMKEGRSEEAYALLGNAFEQFNGKKIRGVASEKESKEIYEAIERRAIRNAKKTVDKDPHLANDFLKLADDIEKTIEDKYEKVGEKYEKEK